MHQHVALDSIKLNPRNTKTHPKRQISQIATSIKHFGFVVPIVIDEHNVLLAGHGRVAAARQLGLKEVPAILVHGLSEARKRALLIADNKTAEGGGWDRERLFLELEDLKEVLCAEDLEISITGFEAPEIDFLHDQFEDLSDDPSPDMVATDEPPISREGDLWILGKHRLLCGDCRKAETFDRLMDKRRAQAAFLDPPFNVKISNTVGRGAAKYREFAMGSGEMAREEFVAFLSGAFANCARVSVDGALHYACIDWRHLEELLVAGRASYGAMVNLVAWVKSNAGQGSFYRSQHELIGVFRVGEGPHQNNVELGRHGRNRSNVWTYAGASGFRAGRMDDLALHPTIKPTALIADALKDCTRRGDIVLDAFCGAGSTLLAAERVGRRGYGMEIDPLYVDVAVRRWQRTARSDAILEASGLTFDQVKEQRDSKLDDEGGRQ